MRTAERNPRSPRSRRNGQSGGPAPKAVIALFSRIAPAYDLLNHLFSLGIDLRWRRRAARRAARGRSVSVLDSCCGTADQALALARANPAAVVTGVDLAGEMLRIGRRKVRRAGLERRIRLLSGDALALPFAADSFEAAVVSFGLRNLPDRRRALAEMVRVIKPGGLLLVLEFLPPANTLPGRVFRAYLGRIMPVVGAWVSGDRTAYRYLFASVVGFPPPGRLLELMREAGCRTVRMRRLTGGLVGLFEGRKRRGSSS